LASRLADINLNDSLMLSWGLHVKTFLLAVSIFKGRIVSLSNLGLFGLNNASTPTLRALVNF
jgi:hypothetical protein